LPFTRMRQYTDDINDRLAKFGRPANSDVRIFGLQMVVGLSRAEAEEKYERLKENIHPEAALAWMSGHFGLDFSKFDPEEYVQNIEVPGIQGLYESVIYSKGGAPVTIREAALYYAQGMDMPVAIGTMQDIADPSKTAAVSLLYEDRFRDHQEEDADKQRHAAP